MDAVAGPAADATDSTPQARAVASLDHAAALRASGRLPDATAELEATLAAARETPYALEFQTRLNLAMDLAELYLASGATDRARELLADEAAFAEHVIELVRTKGTPDQARAAMLGNIQIRDRAAQVALLGRAAPEIVVEAWVLGEPTTLASLRGKVVVLEFWATWCKPCLVMFPKLVTLHQTHAPRGLEVVALTRYYSAIRGTPEARANELEVIRRFVQGRGLEFRVGVAEDERNQRTYGATGVPAVAVIGRDGLVRYASFAADDAELEAVVQECLDERVVDE